MLTYWEHWRACSAYSGGSRGEGPGAPDPPIRPDTCLLLELLHRQDRISPLKWLIISMKRALNFVTKLNSSDIKKKIVFGYPVGDWRSQIEKHVVVSVRGNLPQKSPTVPFEPNFGPPTNKKIPTSPPRVIYHKLLLISRPANKPQPHPILGLSTCKQKKIHPIVSLPDVRPPLTSIQFMY